jgi:ketosteroid isomerase-like protein
MSEQEPEIVARLRGVYDAFSRGDFNAAIQGAHPEVEFFPPSGEAPLVGAGRLREWMEPNVFDRQVIEPLEFTVAGDKVLVRQRGTVRGVGSGIEVTTDSWTVWTFDDAGLITRVENFRQEQADEARRAAGAA